MANKEQNTEKAVKKTYAGNNYIDIDPYQVEITQTTKPRCPICGAGHDKSEHDD